MPDQFRELVVYLNIGKKPARWSRSGVHEPTLENVTRDKPSRAARVIASVKVTVRIPTAMLDRDGPPLFVTDMELDASALRQVRLLGIDLLPQDVPSLDTEIPLQEPVEVPE